MIYQNRFFTFNNMLTSDSFDIPFKNLTCHFIWTFNHFETMISSDYLKLSIILFPQAFNL